MAARTMIPIDIESWPNVDPELKAKLWLDIKNTFKVAPESETMVLKSAGAKWRQFKSKLTVDYVMPFLGEKKKLKKPPLKYAFVGKDIWKKFVSQRTSDEWMLVRKSQSDRVKHRKYPHRTSRKGYTGLREEEMKKGYLEPGEVPDRAILWKKARVPKVGQVDEELAKIYERIDSLLEKKRKGEFQPSGSQDVLTTTLETPEHSGRVRGVGSFVTPAMFFDLPKQKRTRITKAELLAQDKQRDEEMEKTKQDFMAKIASLEALINANNISSQILSDKASCEPNKELIHEVVKVKPSFAKELIVDEDDECVAILPTPPTIKVKNCKCGRLKTSL